MVVPDEVEIFAEQQSVASNETTICKIAMGVIIIIGIAVVCLLMLRIIQIMYADTAYKNRLDTLKNEFLLLKDYYKKTNSSVFDFQMRNSSSFLNKCSCSEYVKHKTIYENLKSDPYFCDVKVLRSYIIPPIMTIKLLLSRKVTDYDYRDILIACNKITKQCVLTKSFKFPVVFDIHPRKFTYENYMKDNYLSNFFQYKKKDLGKTDYPTIFHESCSQIMDMDSKRVQLGVLKQGDVEDVASLDEIISDIKNFIGRLFYGYERVIKPFEAAFPNSTAIGTYYDYDYDMKGNYEIIKDMIIHVGGRYIL